MFERKARAKMKRQMPISLALTLILATTDSGIACSQQPTVMLAKIKSEASYLPSILVEAEGRVELKREQWEDYQQIGVGTELYPGDLLRVATGVKVRIRCANGIFWRVPADGDVWGVNNGCQPVPSTRSDSIGDPRPGNNRLIPYIISPRNTLLLTNKPTLRWSAVPGVTSYTVSISDQRVGKGTIWKTQVSGTEVVYPGDTPLEPEVDYLVIVEADDGSSSKEEELPGLGFKLLDRAQAQNVRDAVEAIAREFSGEAKAIALASLYRENDLKAEAIETLKALAATGSKTSAIYRILGDLYRQLQLNELAEKRYLKAVELATTIEGKAQAQVALAQGFAARRNWTEAIRYGEAALDGYERLGDAKQISELKKQLERWNQRNRRGKP